MSKQEILVGFDAFSEQLLLALAEGERLKKQVKLLIEENARLRLENKQLQDLLLQLQPSPQDDQPQPLHDWGSLEAIYEEGFHICNDFYGQSRDSAENCAFCTEILYRD